MTAIKTGGNDGRAPGCDQCGAHCIPKLSCSPEKHVASEAVVSTTVSTVNAARERFAAAVSRGVTELTGRYGYCRDRAAALLLGEIRGDDAPPSDNEVFRAMEYLRMGMEEASKTVAVARALRRARLERGLSAVEAIDDLTSKLSLSNLVGKVDSLSSQREDAAAASVVVPAEPSSERSSDESENACVGLPSAPRSPSSTQKKNALRPQNCGRPKGVARNMSTKVLGRKRPLSACDDAVTKPSISQNDGKDMVVVELSKKAKIAEEGGNPSDSSIRCKSPAPTIVRAKRSAGHRGEDQQLLNQQPTLKRARAGSDL